MPVSCTVRRTSGGRVVVLRAGLSLTGGTELQGGGGIARAGGLASKVQECSTAPVKRSGIAEGRSASVDLFSLIYLPWSTWADLRFTMHFIQFNPLVPKATCSI